jgi:ParB family chromosome partitioning protein
VKFGPWLERLECIAAGRELVATGGWRDVAGVAPTAGRAHVVPVTLLDDKGAGWTLDTQAAVRAVAFVGDELLLTGGDDGRVHAWDVTGSKLLATVEVGAAVRAIAVDADVARGADGAIVVGTAAGGVHVISVAIVGPKFTKTSERPVSDGAIYAVAFDPAGLVVAGGADGQLYVATKAQATGGGDSYRAITPGGDGGIRAVVCIGDGRAAVACGDGSVRLCFLVGDVEATDRSGDHGHQGAVRALVLGPVVSDDAGREQPRRLFSVGEDGSLKAWFVDGARRPKTVELGIGPVTAAALQATPVAIANEKKPGVGRLWFAATSRKVGALVLNADVEPVGGVAALGSELDRLESELRDPKAAVKVKLDAVDRLASIAEDEARVLLDVALATAPPEVRVATTSAMVRSNRRLSRPALRGALNNQQGDLRIAAFHALLELDREQPLVAIRAGRASTFEDVRARAIDALIPQAPSSVIAAAMIADGLRDAAPVVRQRALAALRQVSTPIEVVRIALARGTPDIRATALLLLGFSVKANDAPARALASTAMDDADPGVRTAAFLTAIRQRPRLAARLYASLPNIQQLFNQLATQYGAPLDLPPPGDLDDEQLEPLFAALACRAPDAAIRGAGALLALGDPRALGAVLQLTREADPALRRGATANLVAALARWPNDDRLSARLVWLLDDPDAEVRSFAFDALAKAAAAGGVDAELDLAELSLRCSQEDMRVRALQILVRIGAPGSPSAPTVGQRANTLLGDALDDEAAKVRSEAFRTLWAWHTADPETPLTRGAASRHADLRMQVIAEIDRRRQAKQATPAMEKLLVGLVKDPVLQVGMAAWNVFARKTEDGSDPAIATDIVLTAMASPVPGVRAAGATAAKKAPAASVRGRLVELIKEDVPIVHLAAIEALDVVAPNDAEGFVAAFNSIFWELNVRAGELCGKRRDARAVSPMQRILSIPKTDINRPPDVIRQRAAAALADVGDPGAMRYLEGLIADEDPIVREMAARGIATAARPGQEAPLLALLGHADLPVRSWGGEGLAKLGDLRALPVLAGTQRHDHRPLRIGAIVGFVALGPDGVRGLRQGLEDRDREIQDLAFAVIVARDAALAEAGIAPDLLVDAMASPSAEIRFAAARLFERRAAGEAMSPEVIGEIVGPRKPEKAADMKEWPPPPRRAAILDVLRNAIASSEPGLRYAAAQVLAARTQPATFWREAARLAGPSAAAPAPNTGFAFEGRVARREGWLRRLVTTGAKRDPEASRLEDLARAFLRAGESKATGIDAVAAQRLVFGVYAGLVRQAPARGAADETHRVRRDAVGRLLELAREEAVGAEAVLPVLEHALGDPHNLVRQAAMAAVRSLYPHGALAPLAMAIAASPDIGKDAIDELLPLAEAGDARAVDMIKRAIDADHPETRAHAALRVVRLYPAGSAEPQLLAAQSKHADVRLAAITQLANATEATPAITDALVAALGSEHADLRLRAAVALARRGNPLGIDVLGAFLRDEDHDDAALAALVTLADRETSAAAAAESIAGRLDEHIEGPAYKDQSGDMNALIRALGTLRHPAGAPAIIRLVTTVPPGKESSVDTFVPQAFDALGEMLLDRTKRAQILPDGRTRARYRETIALPYLADAARSPVLSARYRVAQMLGDFDDRAAEDLLERLLSDRDPSIRFAAAESLAMRAEYVPSATLSALDAALRGGRRELVLPAALGLAARKRPEAFQPLLLVIKAGEPAEQERALLAFGSLGDRRALDHLLPLLEPAPDDAVARQLNPAAIEALGRLLPSLQGDEAADIRARLERLAVSGNRDQALRAITGLRYAGQIGLIERIAADREAGSGQRLHAIEQLGLALSPSSEPVLAELLHDEDYSTRNAAMTALMKLLAGDRTRVSLYALGSSYDHISGPAARFLAASGDASTLIERLGSVKSADIRRMLREGLIRRGEVPRAPLESALRNTDPRPRAEAAWLTGYAGSTHLTAKAGESAARMLSDATATAVGLSESGFRSTDSGARGGTERLVDEAHAWRASLWAARRVGASGTVAVESAATNALADTQRTPHVIRREAAEVLASARSGSALNALTKSVGDADREVRAVASAAIAALQPAAAESAVRAIGARADATTIAPLALTAWPALAPDLVAEPSTRSWALAVSLLGNRAAELIKIAEAKARGEDAGRLAAIAALGAFGKSPDVETINAVLEKIHADTAEPDAVKLAAWKALRRLLRTSAKTYAEGVDKGKGGSRSGGASSSSDDGDSDDGSDSDSDGDSDDDDSDDDDDDDSDDDDESDDEEDEDDDE